MSAGPAKRAIAKLRAMPPPVKAQSVLAYAEQDCGNLIRLTAGCSAEAQRLVWANVADFLGNNALMDEQRTAAKRRS